MKTNNEKSMLNEVVDVNGSKVFVENGEVKTILSEEIQQNGGDMTVEQLREIIKAEVAMIYKNEIHNQIKSIKQNKTIL